MAKIIHFVFSTSICPKTVTAVCGVQTYMFDGTVVVVPLIQFSINKDFMPRLCQ